MQQRQRIIAVLSTWRDMSTRVVRVQVLQAAWGHMGCATCTGVQLQGRRLPTALKALV